MAASPGKPNIRLPNLRETVSSLSVPEHATHTCQQLIEFPPREPEGDKQGFARSVGRMTSRMQQLKTFE